MSEIQIVRKTTAVLLTLLVAACASEPQNIRYPASGRTPSGTGTTVDQSVGVFIDGVDISSLVKFANDHTYQLSRPIVVYNWSRQKNLQDSTGSDDPRGFAYIKTAAQTYWKEQFENPNSVSDYGHGLYVAVDPVVSYAYFPHDFGRSIFSS